MLCYKDMTFCNAKCFNQTCTRKLTEEDIDNAIKWWGNEDFPVAMSDFSSKCLSYEPLSL